MKTGWATEREKVGEIWNRVKKCSASSQEQCRGSLSRSRPASWGSWEACIPKFRVNLKSVEFIVFYPIRVCLNSHLLENNQFCPIFSDRILFLPLPSRSRPSPPISSTLLTSLASDYLIAVQMRAREQFFPFFPTRLEHPNTRTQPAPDQPEFCLYLILTLFQFRISCFPFNYLILLNKSAKVELWISLSPHRLKAVNNQPVTNGLTCPLENNAVAFVY